MFEKLKDGANKLYHTFDLGRRKSEEMNSMKNLLKLYRNRTGRPQLSNCMKSQMPRITSKPLCNTVKNGKELTSSYGRNSKRARVGKRY
jgi:hypothetical protein